MDKLNHSSFTGKEEFTILAGRLYPTSAVVELRKILSSDSNASKSIQFL